MGTVVKLEDVIDAIDLPDEWESLLDPQTGEILSISEEDRSVLEGEVSDEDRGMPDWQRESIRKLRALLETGRALVLPDRFDIHEWELMKRFANDVEDVDASTELLSAIHGTGAFRFFKATVARLGMRDAWFGYRDQALRELAREWLEANEIGYTEEDRPTK